MAKINQNCLTCKNLVKDYGKSVGYSASEVILRCSKRKQMAKDCEMYICEKGKVGRKVLYGFAEKKVHKGGGITYAQIASLQWCDFILDLEAEKEEEIIVIREYEKTKSKTWAIGKLFFETKEEAEKELRRLRGY